MSGLSEWDPERPLLLHIGQGALKMVFGLEAYRPSGPEPSPAWIVMRSGNDSFLEVWDSETGRLVHTLCGHDINVWSLATYALPCDGRPRIATGDRAGVLRLWDGDSGEALQVMADAHPGQGVTALCVYYEPGEGKPRLVSGGAVHGSLGSSTLSSWYRVVQGRSLNAGLLSVLNRPSRRSRCRVLRWGAQGLGRGVGPARAHPGGPGRGGPGAMWVHLGGRRAAATGGWGGAGQDAGV
jgi:WD40 repeat protein